jgi:dienelactone hydrolase
MKRGFVMKRWFGFIAGIVLVIATGSIAQAAVPASTFSYDAAKPLAARVVRTWHEEKATLMEVNFASPSGGRIHADVVLPTGEGPHPGVLFVHWLGDLKTTNLTEFLPDAIALAGRGAVCVLVDTMWAKPGWFDKIRKPDHDYADSVKQVVDLRRALGFLEAQPGVDSRRIAYVGHDFGAMYGAVLSAFDQRPRWYVLMAGTKTFSEWYLLGSPPANKNAYVAQMRPLDPLSNLARSTARNFLFQFSLHDAYVPIASAQAFADAAPGERAVYFYSAGHSLRSKEIQTDRLDWIESRIFQTK